MKRLQVFGLAALLVGALAILLWRSDVGEPARSDGSPTETGVAPELRASEAARVDLPDLTGSALPTATPLAPPTAATKDGALAQPAAAPQAELRGRFLLPDGSPASADLVVNGWESNSASVREHGLPTDWKDFTGVTDATGAFSLRFVAPQAFQFTLEAHQAGFGQVQWRLSHIGPTEVVDVGTLVLPLGGGVRGHVLDPAGRPAPGRWSVMATSVWQPQGPGGDATRREARFDPATGAFEIGDMPPGPAELTANGEFSGWLDNKAQIDVREGEFLERDLVCTECTAEVRAKAEAAAHAIRIRAWAGVFGLVSPDPALATIRAHASAEPTASFATDGCDIVAGNLAPGRYEVSIDDPRFLPWSESDVEPGRTLFVELRPSSVLRLLVTQAEDGKPVTSYRAWASYKSEQDGFDLVPPGSPPPVDGLCPGLVAAWMELTIEAPGRRTRTVSVHELRPGETSTLTVSLEAGALLEGVVRRSSSGQPAAGVLVQVASPAPEASEDDEPSSFLPVPTFVADATTSADGSFLLAGLPAGDFVVRAEASALGRSAWQPCHLTDGQAAHAELALDGEATLRIRVTGLGKQAASCTATLHATAEDRQQDMDDALRRPLELHAGLDADAHCQFAGLDAGGYRLLLTLPSGQRSFGGRSYETGSAAILLGELSLAAGATNARDFDLGPAGLGELRVSLLRRGQPAIGSTVELEALDVDPSVNGQPVAALVGPDGIARFAPVFGGQWRLHAADSGGDWSATRAEPVVVRPGTCTDITWSMDTVAGRIRVVSGLDGAPLRRHRLYMNLPGGSQQTLRTTDDEGWLDLDLPAGHCTAEDWGPDAKDWLHTMSSPAEDGQRSFEWTAEGPQPATLELPPAKVVSGG